MDKLTEYGKKKAKVFELVPFKKKLYEYDFYKSIDDEYFKEMDEFLTRMRDKTNGYLAFPNNDEANRMIEVAWDIATDSVYRVSLQISAVDQPGILANIMMVASESKLNINSLNVHVDKRKTAYISMGVDIRNAEQLEYIIAKIKSVKGIYNVERIISTSIGG